MAWVGRDLKNHLVSTPLPWTGMCKFAEGADFVVLVDAEIQNLASPSVAASVSRPL